MRQAGTTRTRAAGRATGSGCGPARVVHRPWGRPNTAADLRLTAVLHRIHRPYYDDETLQLIPPPDRQPDRSALGTTSRGPGRPWQDALRLTCRRTVDPRPVLPAPAEQQEATPVKFRVERDVLADAVAWAARSLPVRPSAPVLAGLLHRGRVDRRSRRAAAVDFDYETSARATLNAEVADEGTALVSGRLLADICRSLPNKPVEMAVDGAEGHADLWLGPVQPADDAGGGLPDAARRCRQPRGTRAERALRPRGRPGGHRRRPRRHAAGAHRCAPRDRGRDDLAAGHRPLPALAARARLGPGGPRHLRGRPGAGQGAGRHRQVADRRHARSRSRCRPRGHGRGDHRLRGLRRRRRAPYDDPAARRRVPQGPLAVPQRAPDRRRGRHGRRWSTPSSASPWSPSATPRCSWPSPTACSPWTPAPATRRRPASRSRPTINGDDITTGFNPQFLLDGLSAIDDAVGRAGVHARRPSPS